MSWDNGPEAYYSPGEFADLHDPDKTSKAFLLAPDESTGYSLRQAAQLADLALDRLNWTHPAYAGDDVAEVGALAGAAKSALEHVLYGPNSGPLDEPAEWMLPPSLEEMAATVEAEAQKKGASSGATFPDEAPRAPEVACEQPLTDDLTTTDNLVPAK